MNVLHYSFQGVTASQLERSWAFLTVQRYNRSPFLTVCPNIPERSVSVSDRL
jgi:hypothetical protein